MLFHGRCFDGFKILTILCLSDVSKKTVSNDYFVVVTLGKCIAPILKNMQSYKR